jgi:hypothetical protein
MFGSEIKIVVSREPWDGKVNFLLGEKTEHGTYFVAQPLQLSEHPDGHVVNPFMTLDDEQTQRMMDELWRCGFRPREGTGSAGSLAATERHLKDMRKIAFHTLKINEL